MAEEVTLLTYDVQHVSAEQLGLPAKRTKTCKPSLFIVLPIQEAHLMKGSREV